MDFAPGLFRLRVVGKWESFCAQEILQEHPRQNPPKLEDKSPTYVCRVASLTRYDILCEIFSCAPSGNSMFGFCQVVSQSEGRLNIFGGPARRTSPIPQPLGLTAKNNRADPCIRDHGPIACPLLCSMIPSGHKCIHAFLGRIIYRNACSYSYNF